ncbi:MAG: pyridoxal-phosphate dependent enzyme [Spirochaetia bacterium]|jgi:threonine synthase|nr:pyridoxal-phosphate dependent enzyme [Spirochaetia bacterium]
MRWFYACPSCGKTYDIEPGRYLCDQCAGSALPGQPLEGVLECRWEAGSGDADRKAAEEGRLIPLPVEQRFFPSLPVGDTPLWAPRRLRDELDAPGLYLKDDTCNPSGSFKDRASWLVGAFAVKHGIKEIALASTGNAASSMACVGAAAGIKVKVFVPASAPSAKRIQVLQYGGELVEVQGTYDKAFDDSLAYSKATGVLSRNTAYNPLTIEGKKTAAFEIARDLASSANASAALRDLKRERDGSRRHFIAPDHVFVPTGDGVILSGLIKGFEDMLALGLVRKMPIFWASQAEGSSAIARALDTGEFLALPSETLADSISVDVPRNGSFVVKKMVKYGGRAVTVSDPQIAAAQRRLASSSGLFAEPSSACAFACYLKVRESIGHSQRVVIMLTGSGLKDIKNAAAAVGAAL